MEFEDKLDNEDLDLAIIERRSAVRRPPVIEPTFVWVSFDDRIQTRMMDQAQGGISVVAPRSCNFEEGFEIRVEVGDGYRMATIAYVSDFDETRVRLGLCWNGNSGHAQFS